MLCLIAIKTLALLLKRHANEEHASSNPPVYKSADSHKPINETIDNDSYIQCKYNTAYQEGYICSKM